MQEKFLMKEKHMQAAFVKGKAMKTPSGNSGYYKGCQTQMGKTNKFMRARNTKSLKSSKRRFMYGLFQPSGK